MWSHMLLFWSLLVCVGHWLESDWFQPVPLPGWIKVVLSQTMPGCIYFDFRTRSVIYYDFLRNISNELCLLWHIFFWQYLLQWFFDYINYTSHNCLASPHTARKGLNEITCEALRKISWEESALQEDYISFISPRNEFLNHSAVKVSNLVKLSQLTLNL